ncbi:MAG: molecular chaperone TorD family protein, partial [Candidatus Dormibacteraeota bacterium]|nr:molecular chaperone TorD family protein [Candidatus Dormibacteraeota bacterium]
LYPYASVYLGPEGMIGGEARDRVAGFWRALSLSPPVEADHLTPLLGLYAALAEDGSERAGHARKALLWEHLLSWLPPYLDAVHLSPCAFPQAWAGLLGEVLVAEAEAFGPPAAVPLALRHSDPLPDPRQAGGGPFLAGLLAPARCGMILVRDDLVHAAADLGLGLRRAERRYALEGLLGQDPEGMLRWLASHARDWGARHRDRPRVLQSTSAIWGDRAAAAAALLADLRGGLKASAGAAGVGPS